MPLQLCGTHCRVALRFVQQISLLLPYGSHMTGGVQGQAAAALAAARASEPASALPQPARQAPV